MLIIKNEIIKLFINENIRFIHFIIEKIFNYQQYHISGDERCFSELESFHCDDRIDQNILEGLARTCKSIKKLSFTYTNPNINNSGMKKLI